MSDVYTQGTKFEITKSETSPEDYATIAGVTGFTGVSLTRSTIDKSDHESTIREYFRSIPEGGEVTMHGNYVQDDAGQLELKDAVENEGPSGTRGLRVTLPVTGAADVMTCTIIALGWMIGPMDADSKVDFEFTFKIVSVPSWA